MNACGVDRQELLSIVAVEVGDVDMMSDVFLWDSVASNLNSRVIQMVIAKNLTLAQAWGILDLARTNSTGTVTAFPFFSTAEFHTLGFVDEVNSLVANTSVANGGNTSVAPPPTSWQLFWNTIAGLASGPWNPWIAVGAFFYN